MGKTQVKGPDVGDASIGRVDLVTGTPGNAVITKIVEKVNSGIKIAASTGADPGTGDVQHELDWPLLNLTYVRNDARPELQLYAGTQAQLLAAWATAILASVPVCIFITANIVFTADQQFIQSTSPIFKPAIKIEAITTRSLDAGSHVIDYGNVVFTNIAFRTSGTFYFRLVGGYGAYYNCTWPDDVADTGAKKKNIVVIGPVTGNTGKIVLKNVVHYTQSATDNISNLIQPFWIENQATFVGTGSRLYVEILEVSAVSDASHFSRVLLTSTIADCSYFVTGDESWFYAPTQAMPGASNIASYASILRTTNIDKLNPNMPVDDATGYILGIAPDGKMIRKSASAVTIQNRIVEVKVNSSALTVGNIKGNFFVPEELNGAKIIKVEACITTVGTVGLTTVDIYNVTTGLPITSPSITIDINEKTSYTAATRSAIWAGRELVYSGTEICCNVLTVGTGAAGLSYIVTFEKQ